jgi:FkbM family methyltransferase
VTFLIRTGSLVGALLGRRSRIVRAFRPSYEWLLDAVSCGRGIEWPVNNITLRIDPRMRRFVASVVEPELWEWLQTNVAPGEQILDVGSFLGVYAVVLARWAGSSGRVLAFEPTPRIVPTLQRHVDINGVSDRVKVVPVALGELEGEVELHEHSDPYRNAVGLTDPNGLGTKTSRVRATTIDQECREQGFEPTLLRMDVQGFERAVLLGARETITRGRGRLRMVVEVHPQLWPLHGFDGADFDRTLSELGLRARALKKVRGLDYEPDGHVVLEYR